MNNELICPRCKTILEITEGKFFCKICGFPNTEDLRKIHADSDPIDDIVINDFFYLIAHEYKRLLDMIKNREVYGALLQVKDVWEILLKYPVLLKIGYIYQSNIDERDKVLSELFTKALSLGDWKALGIKLNNLKLSTPKELDAILSNIIKLYNVQGDNDIVNWRNETIGHGALSIDKESILNDINRQVKRIREHLRKCEKYYRLLLLKTKQHEKECILKGLDCSLLQNRDETVGLFDNNSADITPFIYLYNNEIFFYDTFSYRAQSVIALDYINGIKKEVPRNSIFFNIFEEIKKDFSESLKKFGDYQNAEQATLLNSSQKLLQNKIDNNDRMIPVKYLYDWLIKGIQNNSKSVFLLRMAKGMGKTTFCSTLKKRQIYKDKKHKNALSEMGVSVYVLNLNDTTLCKQNQFVWDVKESLKHNRDYTDWIKRSDIEEKKENLSQISTKEQFANLLRLLKKLRNRHGWYDKVLLVIDGLDEIPDKYLKGSIIDLIPDESSLPEDFYILLTARISHEISSFKEEKIKQLSVAADKLVICDYTSPDYKKLLWKYAKKYLKDEDSLEFVETQLSDSSQVNFTEFALLIDLILYDKNNVTAIKNQNGVLKTFFKYIHNLYTEKFSQTLINYVLTLASSYEPLTVKMLSDLNGEVFLSFGTLGRVKDINSILKIERGEDGNLISLAHSTFIEYIKNNYINENRQIVENWINYITINFQRINGEADAYLLSYFLKYCEDYGFSKDQFTANAKNNVISAIKVYAKNKNDWYNIHDNYKLRQRYLRMVELFDSLAVEAGDKFLANYWYGMLYYSELDYRKAKHYLNFVINDQKTKTMYCRYWVCAVLVHAKIMQVEGNSIDAFRNLLIAKKLIDEDVNNVIDRTIKEKLYYMLAHIYIELGKREKAVSMFKTLKSTLQDVQTLDNEEYLYWLDAVINTSNDTDEICIKDLKERWGDLITKNNDYDLLLTYCLRLGQRYMNNNMIDKAIQTYNEGYEILNRTGEIFLSESCMDILLNLSYAYIENKDFENADLLFKKINVQFEKYQKYLAVNLKLTYFLHRGFWHYSKKNYDGAIKFYDNGISVLKRNTDFNREIYCKFLVKKIECLLAYESHDQITSAKELYDELKKNVTDPYYQNHESLLIYAAKAAFLFGEYYTIRNKFRLAEEFYLEVKTILEDFKGCLTSEEADLLRKTEEKLKKVGYFTKVRRNDSE